ncbi:unnamed protein product, partial [Rodentolepis nana]|uniref:Thrombospondin n=1 Tax=Rodentolepis nana TaxID=102285 RepID=A0A158QIX4_RODNA
VLLPHFSCEPLSHPRGLIIDDIDSNKLSDVDSDEVRPGERILLEVKKRPPPNVPIKKANPVKSVSLTHQKLKNIKKVPSIPPVTTPKPEVKKAPIKLNPVHLKRNPQPVVPKPVKVVKKVAERKLVPTYDDHDCDGIPDDVDDDVDNDGLLDRTQDSDWDGLLNHVDDDDDNDGIPDKEDEDSNGDGIPDCRLDTTDHKMKLRFGNKQKVLDSDMDGIPDDVDLDDDNNGIPDMLEDRNGDQIPDFLEPVIDELRTLDDVVRLNKMMAAVGWSDRDCDGIPDHLDPDDDNDGYFDKKQDSDRDGILNEYDDDDDNDGIPDIEDLDANGDGIPDCVIQDSDGDGIPDHIDTDDDNDGIPDLKDPNHKFFNFFRDSDNDGIPDILDKDDDNDGIPDHLDSDGVRGLGIDSDGDGFPDAIDDDMNDDGIPDHLQDHDCDGIPDIIDPDDDNDGYFDNKQDSDNDGILNEWDDDDDNDGIPDSEDEDSNGDGIPDCQPKDSDGDGIPDHLDDDDDNDGIPDHLDPDHMAFLMYKPKNLEAMTAQQAQHEANTMAADLGDPGDKDCDGIPDEEDDDMDNDGKIDRTQDSDWDGLLNHIDDDDDNDGIPDYLDPDANGDGIPDCNRNKSVHYHVVRTFGGAIKKVIKVRQLTEEEDALTRLKEAVDHRLHRIRALMDPSDIQPTPTQFVKSNRAPILTHPPVPKKANQPNPSAGKKIVPPKKMKTEAKFVQKNPSGKPKVPVGQMGKRKLAGLLMDSDEDVQKYSRKDIVDLKAQADEVI